MDYASWVAMVEQEVKRVNLPPNVARGCILARPCWDQKALELRERYKEQYIKQFGL